MESCRALGVDVGGTRMRAAWVDTASGARDVRQEAWTPRSRTPTAIASQVAAMVDELGGGDGPVGITLPGVIRHDGVVLRAANLARSWEGCDAVGLLSAALNRPVVVLNDADAAGIAEIRFGAGRAENRQVLMLTFGTGIGSALFQCGRLFSCTEFGHLQIDGLAAEKGAAWRAVHHERLSWSDWTARVNRYLEIVETVLYPDLIIFGGGASLHSDAWWHLVRTRARRELAVLLNDAGMVGAAMVAHAALVASPSD